ncbi:16S rRNA (cytosine(967)-C(5))-methyltransferase [Synechococcus sp. CCY 9618]|uniref:16S rRNA (cytosine(967)-C(5))-methyltransferase n=1 Tax=Synechococcus sp. CCY 9618 TaxID=2815602 RepID=UPI001C241969|nr:16S rRNA (cytosine(967)-C(5))-methyltransferase [Synechococcus sp. CCY 9618]
MNVQGRAPIHASDVVPGLAPRQLAWQVLQAVAAGAYADAALERELVRRGGGLSPADRALATEITYGTIRQRQLLDGWIDELGKVPALRQPPTLRWLLHVGLYQLLFSRRVPPSAAVSTTVALAKRGGLGRLAPMANGLLRSLLRRRDRLAAADPWDGLPLPADPAASLALRRSLPPWLATELLGWLPPEQAEAFGVACNSAPAFDLRVNPMRTTRQALLDAFTAAGVPARPLSEAPHGITLLERVGNPRDLPGYGEGLWCVQDRSAQCIAPLLDPLPGQRILDACAAPGGKSTHLAELSGDRGEVWAVDRSSARLQRLERNAERLGLGSIRSLAADATALGEAKPHWRASFDRILLDAPCSGLGTLARHPDARWRITPGAIEGLVPLQRQLLEGLLPLLAPGGRLVYATCTVHPMENGTLISALLRDHPDWRLLQERQWWPQPATGERGGGDGFYAAVLEGPAATGP